jgi:hypothetical protein
LEAVPGIESPIFKPAGAIIVFEVPPSYASAS